MNEDVIIVGSSVHALLMSYHKRIPIVLTKFNPPSPDQMFKRAIVIEGIPFKRYNECWEFLKFVISKDGLVRNHAAPTYVRVEDEITFNSSDQRLSLKYDKCLLFSDDVVKCVNEIKKIANKGIYRVLDFIRLKHCSVLGLEPLHPKHTHIAEVIFSGAKDIICVSYLNKEQLLNFDYSDTMSRFIMEKELLNTEFKQPFLDKDKKYKRKPSPVVVSRHVESVERVIYEDSEKIKNYGYNDEKRIEQTYRRHSAGLKD